MPPFQRLELVDGACEYTRYCSAYFQNSQLRSLEGFRAHSADRRDAPSAGGQRQVCRHIGWRRGSVMQKEPRQHLFRIVGHRRSEERRSVKSVSVRVDLGGRRVIKKENKIRSVNDIPNIKNKHIT